MTIKYDLGKYHCSLICKARGSLIPRALLIALPAALIAAIIRIFLNLRGEEGGFEFLEDMRMSGVWGAMTGVMGLVLAFRTSQALSRYWEGCTLLHQMRAEWLDATSNLIAFSSTSRVTHEAEVWNFWHTLVRLVSLLHGFALFEIKEFGHNNKHFPVIDIEGLDDESLEYLQKCSICEAPRVEIVLHWIQQLIVANINNGVISAPPPIVSRVFQELGGGMVHLRNAKKLTEMQFPFPYAQFVTVILLVYTCLTPLIVASVVQNPFLVSAMSMVPLFAFWCINLIAGEVENPFGDDVNDLPLQSFQVGMNDSLVTFLEQCVHRAPGLSSHCVRSIDSLKSPDFHRHRTDIIDSLDLTTRGDYDRSKSISRRVSLMLSGKSEAERGVRGTRGSSMLPMGLVTSMRNNDRNSMRNSDRSSGDVWVVDRSGPRISGTGSKESKMQAQWSLDSSTTPVVLAPSLPEHHAAPRASIPSFRGYPVLLSKASQCCELENDDSSKQAADNSQRLWASPPDLQLQLDCRDTLDANEHGLEIIAEEHFPLRVVPDNPGSSVKSTGTSAEVHSSPPCPVAVHEPDLGSPFSIAELVSQCVSALPPRAGADQNRV